MSHTTVISSPKDLEALRHAQSVETLLDRAIDELEGMSQQNDKLSDALRDAIAKNKPLRVSRDWYRLGMWVFAVVALVECVALIGGKP